MMQRTRYPKSKVIQEVVNNPAVAQRELCNRSFYRFLRYMWSEVSNEEFHPSPHIKVLCDELQAVAEDVASRKITKDYHTKINDLIINVPPGSTKTTTVMIMFPAWCWSRWFWMKFIALSYSSPLSLESAEANRELVRSEKYKALYPEIGIKQDKDQKSNFQVLKHLGKRPGYPESYKTGGGRYSTSVGGTVTGFHAHIILVDDPINPQQAVSPVQLESTNRWISSTMPTRKIHKACSPTVMIMQRLHQNDPTGYLLEKKKEIRHISLPAEIKNYEKELCPKEYRRLYSEDGLLDPVRMGWEVLNELTAELGQYGASGQLGQSPTPPSGGMFKVDRLGIADRAPALPEIEMVCRFWDKAGTEGDKKSKGKGPAYTVGVKMAKLLGNKYIILNVVRGRWGSEEREDVIRQTAESDGLDCIIGIEQEPGSGGKESAEGTVRNLTGFNVVVQRPTGDKIHRADPYSVQVNWRNVQMMQADWNTDYKEELRFFPHGTFKDQVDASSGAFSVLNTYKEANVW